MTEPRVRVGRWSESGEAWFCLCIPRIAEHWKKVKRCAGCGTVRPAKNNKRPATITEDSPSAR